MQVVRMADGDGWGSGAEWVGGGVIGWGKVRMMGVCGMELRGWGG